MHGTTVYLPTFLPLKNQPFIYVSIPSPLGNDHTSYLPKHCWVDVARSPKMRSVIVSCMIFGDQFHGTRKHIYPHSTNGSLLVWGLVVWIPRIPWWKDDCCLGVSRFESQTTAPQTNNESLADTCSPLKNFKYSCTRWFNSWPVFYPVTWLHQKSSGGHKERPGSVSIWPNGIILYFHQT